MKKLRLLSLLLILCTLFSVLPVSAAPAQATIDITDYPNITAPVHTHIYKYAFDDTGHWRECEICHNITNFASHSIHGNGGVKNKASLWVDNVYRDVCNCGWKGLPQRVIPGRWENWKDYGKFWDGNKWYTFDSVRLISRSEFNQLNSKTYAEGGYLDTRDTHTFREVSNGMGWVFCGGPICSMTDESIHGNLSICGSYDGWTNGNGEITRQSTGEELVLLIRYLNKCENEGRTPTRTDFKSQFQTKSTIVNGTRNPLYGFREKYDAMSDTVFNKVVASLHNAIFSSFSWGWNANNGLDKVRFQGLEHNVGEMWYPECLDNKGKRLNMFSTDAAGTCVFCGTTCTGLEHLTEVDLYHDYYQYRYDGAKLKPGTTLTTENTEPGWETYFMRTDNIISKCWMNYKRTTDNKTYIQWVIKAQGNSYVSDESGNRLPSSMGTYSGSTWRSAWREIEITDSNVVNDWTRWRNIWVWDPDYNRARELAYDYKYALADTVEPTVYNRNNTSYWKVEGNGTVSRTSPQASLTCTFQDNTDYSANYLQVRILDSDGVTFIPQDNGVEWKGLNAVSGHSDLHQGVFDIPTEINGTKTVYAQARDASGNLSAKVAFQVSYIDAVGPKLTFSSVSPSVNEWSRTKTITITGQDAFNNVKIGISTRGVDQMTTVSNSTNNFKKTITFTGNVGDAKAIAIFGQDFTGNLTNQDVIIGKLDNTKPTVKYESHEKKEGYTNVKLSGTDYQVSGNVNNPTEKIVGSGVKYYGWSTSASVTPTNWQTSSTAKITESGTYYFFTKDGVDWVSDPTPGVYIPVQYRLTFDFDKPSIASNSMTGNSPASKLVTNKEEIGALPNPAIKGWTFLGWTIYDGKEANRPSKLVTYNRADKYEDNTRTKAANVADIYYNTIYKWAENKKAQAVWRENTYTVRYLDQQGNEFFTGETQLYDHSYEAPTQEDTGFEKTGYYIAYWSTIPNDYPNPQRFWCKDEDWPVGKDNVQQKFKNLTDVDGGIVDLYAVWKPIPYTLRIVDNYMHSTSPYQDYTLYYDDPFVMPNALWEHGAAVHVGYDRVANTFVHPEWQVRERVVNLTTKRNDIVYVYTIWDNPPQITCEPEYYLKADEVVANGLTANDGTVTRTNLEAWLLTKVRATDYEWTERYGTPLIPPGENRGYTLKVSAFEPAKVVQGAKDKTLTYYITFEVTDDARNSATAVMTLFIADKVNILVK